MRQLIVQVPRGHGKDVLTIAQEHQGTNLAQIQASNSDRALDLVILHLSNRKVENFLSQVDQLPDVQIKCRSTIYLESRWRDLNPRPLDYESSALPLSHIGKRNA
jgi:hypothetical protein